MKPYLTGLIALMVGVTSGWLHSSLSTRSEQNSANQLAASDGQGPLTFLGNPEDEPANLELLLAGYQGSGKGGRFSSERFLALLDQANRRGDSLLRQAVLVEWARRETENGLRELLRSEDSHAGWQLLNEWTRLHPEAAVAIALESPAGKKETRWRNSVLKLALTQLLLTDPDRAAALAPRVQGLRLWREIPPALPAPRRTASAGAMLEALTHFSDSQLKRVCLGQWMGDDIISPSAAIDWAERHLSSPAREDQISNAVARWMNDDPEAAERHVSSRLDGSPESRKLLRTYLNVLSHRGPEEVVAWMRTLDRETLSLARPMRWNFFPQKIRDHLSALIAAEFPDSGLLPEESPESLSTYQQADIPESWPPRTPAQARAWWNVYLYSNQGHLGPGSWTAETMDATLEMLPEDGGQTRGEMARRLASAWAKHDPEKAMNWAAGLPNDISVTATEEALSDWYSHEPQAARDYVTRLPAGEFRAYAIETVIDHWVHRNPKEATAWLDQLPAGFDRDVGRRTAVMELISSDPIAAYQQARAIGHPVMRQEWIEESLGMILDEDPKHALSLLPQSGLPVPVLSKLETRAREAIRAR